MRRQLALALAFAGCYRHITGGAGAGDAEMPNDVRPADALVDVLFDGATPDAPTAPQIDFFTSITATNTDTISITSTSVIGDVMVMAGAIDSGNITSITGGGVTTWMKGDTSTQCANTEIWFGIVTGASAAVTIKINPSPPGDGWIWLSEWSGLETTAPLLDGHNHKGVNGGTNMTPAPGSITTTSPRDLVLLSVASNNGSFATPTSGPWRAWPKTGASVYTQEVWSMYRTSTGTFAPTVDPATACWDAVIVALRAK